MVDRNRRKRLRISSQFSDEEDSAEQVAEDDIIQSSDSDFEVIPTTTAKPSREPDSIPNRIPKVSVPHQPDKQTWVDKYSDISHQNGLVTSTRKSREISTWLRAALQKSRPRMLILAGPPGCGKTSALKAAARELRCSIATWQAPTTGQRYISMTLLEDFESFIIGHRYQTLEYEKDDAINESDAPVQKLLLIKDLPISTSDSFEKRDTIQNLLCDASRFAPCPTVIVISDSEKGMARTARFLLGPQLLSSPHIETIRVPAVTDIMMRRRLGEVLRKEGIVSSRDKVDGTVALSHGDIRAALNALQFSVAQGNVSVPTRGETMSSSSKRCTRKRMRRDSNSTKPVAVFTSVGQDTSLGTYHAVSKILNNKRKEDGASKYIPEDILEHARADPSSFLAFLHHNYPAFFGDIDDVVPALRSLCDADCLLPWMQDDLARTELGDCAASVATRGFLIHNRNAVRSGWRPIRGPESYAVAKEGKKHAEDVQRQLSHVLSPAISTTSLLCEVATFAERITGMSLGGFGLTDDGLKLDGNAVFDSADVAMVDIETKTQELNLSARTRPPRIPDEVQGELEKNMEEIEDWDD